MTLNIKAIGVGIPFPTNCAYLVMSHFGKIPYSLFFQSFITLSPPSLYFSLILPLSYFQVLIWVFMMYLILILPHALLLNLSQLLFLHHKMFLNLNVPPRYEKFLIILMIIIAILLLQQSMSLPLIVRQVQAPFGNKL